MLKVKMPITPDPFAYPIFRDRPQAPRPPKKPLKVKYMEGFLMGVDLERHKCST